MLKRLYVDNVRSLTNFEFRPGQVSVVVGPNGGGKSTIFDALQAVQMFLGSGGTPVSQFFGAPTITRWDSRQIQTVELDVEIPGLPLYTYSLQVFHDAKNRNATVEERLSSGGQLLYRFSDSEVKLYGDHPNEKPRTSFPFDPRRSFLPVLEPRADNERISAFKGWITGVWLFKLRPDRIGATTQQEEDALVFDGSNFASWYRTLQQESPEIVAKILKDIQPVIPGLVSIKLVRVGPDARVLALDCVLEEKPFQLFLDDLSEGQRVLLVLYTILHAIPNRASLLVFDEPDNFVSEAEIQPWLSALRERITESQRGTLVVISHHPSVIDYLGADQIVRVWRNGGPSRSNEPELDRENGLPASTILKLTSGQG